MVGDVNEARLGRQAFCRSVIRSQIHGSHAVLAAAQRAQYYAPRRSHIVRAPVAAAVVGPVYALVPPTTYLTQPSNPADGHHLQQAHNLVVDGTEVVVLMIALIVAGKAVVRYVIVTADWAKEWLASH
jgi:hypothetical protein